MYKRFIKRILPAAIILSVGLSLVFPCFSYEYSKKELYFEDFAYDYVGDKPYTLSVNEQTGSSARIVYEKGENSKRKNMLKLTDTQAKSLASVTLSIPEYEKSVTFEMKFKLIKTTTPGYGFIVDFMGDSKRALRFYKHSGETAHFAIENSGASFSAAVS